MQMNNPTTANSFTKRIGRAVYKVNVHFSEHSKESFNDKLFRLIQNDIAKNAKAETETRTIRKTV